MPIYEFKCKTCGKITEALCQVGERIGGCQQVTAAHIPGLVIKCNGEVERIASVFFVHDSWRWLLVSEDGLSYSKKGMETEALLYESTDEEEHYLGPDHDQEWEIGTTRWSDGVRWDRREEWMRDNYDFDGSTLEHEEDEEEY
jgi:hypothetical protein|tara:strand:+ start:466 stop:894 length:429 start_codon:yes stop_codon:yes gene_type:complete